MRIRIISSRKKNYPLRNLTEANKYFTHIHKNYRKYGLEFSPKHIFHKKLKLEKHKSIASLIFSARSIQHDRAFFLKLSLPVGGVKC